MHNHMPAIDRVAAVELIDRYIAGKYQLVDDLELNRQTREATHAQAAKNAPIVADLLALFRPAAAGAPWLDLGGVDDPPFMMVKRIVRADAIPQRVPTRDVVLRFGLPRGEDLVLVVRANVGGQRVASALALRFEQALGIGECLGLIEFHQRPEELEMLHFPDRSVMYAASVTLHDAFYLLDRSGW